MYIRIYNGYIHIYVCIKPSKQVRPTLGFDHLKTLFHSGLSAQQAS